MNFQRLVKKPRIALRDCDSWVSCQALAAVSRNPVAEDRVFLEECLENENPQIALLGFMGLKKLFPMQPGMQEVWQNLFFDTVDLLEKRASSGSGSAQIRAAATKAMAFATELLSLIHI